MDIMTLEEIEAEWWMTIVVVAIILGAFYALAPSAPAKSDDYSSLLSPYERACTRLHERHGRGYCVVDEHSARFYTEGGTYVGMEVVK